MRNVYNKLHALIIIFAWLFSKDKKQQNINKKIAFFAARTYSSLSKKVKIGATTALSYLNFTGIVYDFSKMFTSDKRGKSVI